MPKKLADGFEFVDMDRTFTCNTEPCRTSSADTWWWFRVSSERQAQRYAPFRADPSDTFANVRSRILTYYEDMLVQRATPPVSRWGNRGRGRPAAAPAAQAAAPAENAPQAFDRPLLILADGDDGAPTEPIALL